MSGTFYQLNDIFCIRVVHTLHGLAADLTDKKPTQMLEFTKNSFLKSES